MVQIKVKFVAVLATTFIALARLGLANNCKVSWPVVLGDVNQDGDTEVTAWAATDDDVGNQFLIGGRSTSLTFTEQKDTCDKVGCAFVVVWNQVGSVFVRRTIYKEVQSVAAIKVDQREDTGLAVIVFMKISSSTRAQYVLQFNRYVGKNWEHGARTYFIKEDIDLTQIDPFNNFMLLDNRRIFYFANLPTKYEVVDYFIEVVKDPKSSEYIIGSFKTDIIATTGTFFNGLPTRKREMMWGFDKSHTLELMTMSLPKGAREFGGPVILGTLTTYNVIASRTIYDTNPMQYEEQFYGVQQTSSSLYYFWKKGALSYIKDADGVSVPIPLLIIISLCRYTRRKCTSTWQVNTRPRLLRSTSRPSS